MRAPLALLLVLAGLLAGCAGDEERATAPATTAPPPAATDTAPTTTAEPETGPVGLVPMPREALRRCRRVPALAPACPAQVPEAPFDPASPVFAADAYPGARPGARVFSLQWGAEHPNEPELDRPPATVHVVVSTAGLSARSPRRARLRDGLLGERRRAYLALGRVTWAGRRGELLLAPHFPAGGIDSNHLVFRWREGGAATHVSLHGWEPLTEVGPALRAVVESLPPSG